MRQFPCPPQTFIRLLVTPFTDHGDEAQYQNEEHQPDVSLLGFPPGWLSNRHWRGLRKHTAVFRQEVIRGKLDANNFSQRAWKSITL